MPSPFGIGQGNQFQRVSRKFNFRGLDIAHPVDRLGDGRFPYIKNFRAYSDGELRSRPGLASIFTIPASPSIHTLARLNDPSTSDYLILAAAAGSIYGGNTQGQFTSGAISTGHSGNRLTLAEMRPSRSPQPWLYVADSTKTAKLNQARTVRTWGIPEVPATPIITTTPPKVLSITEATSTTELAQTWNNSVNAGALSVANRTNTTITYIVYDTGTTGYCAISPAAMGTDIQPGCRIRINSGGGTDEYVVVEQVFALIASTTIESISYDTGTTGLCWIQLATPTAGLVPNCILRIAGAENVRVLDVVIDKDNKAAIRCSTTSTRAATNAVSGLRAFRCSTVSTHAAAQTLTASYLQSTITYPGVAPAGVGNIRLNALRDLSQFSNRPVTDDDEMVVTLYLSDASQLVEGRVWIDIDPLTVPGTYSADDLSRNYLFFPFRPEDLQSFAFFDSTTTQVSATGTNIQRAQFDLFNSSLAQANAELDKRRNTYKDALAALSTGDFFYSGKKYILDQLQAQVGAGGGLGTASPETPGPFQAGSGKEQWFTLRFKIGQLQRIGQDISRTLKDTTSVMVNFTMKKDAQVVRLSSWYISGGANPDMKGSDDLRSDAYYYIIQGRDDRTGARSLPSPPTRSGIVARRQSITITSGLHPNAQVNKLDVYRWGGSRFEFLRLGSMDNTGSPSFVDNFSDDQLGNAEVLDYRTFAPTPTVGLPFSCVVNIVGPKVTWVSGTKFNTKWSPGVLVEIAGRTYILYGSPSSDTVLYLTESAGTLTGVAVSINSPVVLNTPLPVVIGPYGIGFTGQFLFLLGDPLNPHLLYWTNGNDPDTTNDLNFLEVSTPGIPLVGGTIYDGKPYVWSTEQMYLITQNFNPGPGEQPFSSTPIANSRGAVSPTAITSDVYIYFVGKDGIYRAEGGQPSSITDDCLYPLFPHDGIAGSTVNGISPPDYTRAGEFNLTTYGPLVYFDYPGVDANWHTALYDTNFKGWLLDEYSGNGLGVTTHYGERGRGNYRVLTGGTNGIIGAVNGIQDLGIPVQATAWLPCYDGGDERAEKQWGDQILDFNSNGLPLLVETWKDNFSSLVQPADLITTTRKDIRIIDFLSGGQVLESRNLGLKLFYSGSSGLLNLYSWQPSFLARPENISLRATDWDYGAKNGAEQFQAVIITADTDGNAETLQLEFDQQAETRLITINHAGMLSRAYAIDPNVVAHLARVRPTTTNGSLKNFSAEWITESFPESLPFWGSQPTGFDSPGWKHVRECWITLESITDVELQVTFDSQVRAFTLPSTQGNKRQLYLALPARKCRIFSAELRSGQPFVLHERDTLFNVGLWGRGDQYKPFKLFGGSNAENLSQAYV